MLEKSSNLEEDVARRKNVWKKFLRSIHPGDYKKSYPNIINVLNKLYKDNIETFASKIEAGIINKDKKVLKLLESRPGEFARRLVHLLDVFGKDALNSFNKIIPKLSTLQIIMLRRQLEHANMRTLRVFPPKGNWNKVQIGSPRTINKDFVNALSVALGKELSIRVPKVGVLD